MGPAGRNTAPNKKETRKITVPTSTLVNRMDTNTDGMTREANSSLPSVDNTPALWSSPREANSGLPRRKIPI